MVTNIVGPPVRGENCYGRDAFVELVWEKLAVGHVLLAAPRRFGKTSIMYRLMDHPRPGYQFVHADLEHFVEPAELVTALVVQLARDGRLRRVAEGLSYFPKALWKRFSETFDEVELFKFRVKLKEKVRARWQESGEELFRRLADSQGTVVFILDELPWMLERMTHSEAHREEARTLLRWLRALRQSPSASNARFMIAGSIGIGHVLRELGETAAINDFEQLRLEPLSPQVAAGLLDELSSTHQLALSPASRKRMLELIGTLVPYFIQVLFSEAAKVHKQDGRPMTPARVAQVYREKVLGVDCRTYFDHYYGRLRGYYKPREERFIKRLLRELAVVGSLARDTGYQFYREQAAEAPDPETFNHLMSDLENDFYIRFDAQRLRYEFACKLLRDWWLRHYAMEAEA